VVFLEVIPYSYSLFFTVALISLSLSILMYDGNTESFKERVGISVKPFFKQEFCKLVLPPTNSLKDCPSNGKESTVNRALGGSTYPS
jgi:hypothetical protein